METEAEKVVRIIRIRRYLSGQPVTVVIEYFINELFEKERALSFIKEKELSFEYLKFKC